MTWDTQIAVWEACIKYDVEPARAMFHEHILATMLVHKGRTLTRFR